MKEIQSVLVAPPSFARNKQIEHIASGYRHVVNVRIKFVSDMFWPAAIFTCMMLAEGSPTGRIQDNAIINLGNSVSLQMALFATSAQLKSEIRKDVSPKKICVVTRK